MDFHPRPLRSLKVFLSTVSHQHLRFGSNFSSVTLRLLFFFDSFFNVLWEQFTGKEGFIVAFNLPLS